MTSTDSQFNRNGGQQSSVCSSIPVCFFNLSHVWKSYCYFYCWNSIPAIWCHCHKLKQM